MENKNRFIRTIAVIGVLVLTLVTVLPGCNFVGQPKEPDAVVNEAGQQLCCPVCGAIDIAGPDADEYYLCNVCGQKWSYNDQQIDVVDNQGNVVDQVDLSAGIADTNPNSNGSSGGSNSGGNIGGSSGGSNGGSSGGNNGGNSGGNNTTFTTNPNTAEKARQNLEKLSKVVKNFDESVEFTYNPTTGDYSVKSKDGRDTGIFGYKYNDRDKIFYTAEDSWQRNFGFTEVYDDAAALGFMTYNTFRVRFNHKFKGEDLEWMFQFWKGQYGYAFIGAEVGVYTREKGSDNGTYYDCATDEQKIYMTMDVYRENPNNKNKYDHLFRRSRSKTWWCTGFVAGTLGFAQINVPDEGGTAKLKVDVRMEMHNEEMAQAFINSALQIKYLINNSALSGTNRTVDFVQCPNEAAYDASSESCKVVLCEDGKTVRLTYR